MKAIIEKHLTLIPLYLTLLFSLLWLLFFYEGSMNRLFITADQAGYEAYEKRDYLKAAENFEDIAFKAASFYKAGEFKKAKTIYQNLSDKAGKYNLGNTLVMLGKYDAAIKAYELALKMDPNFKEAKENLLIAKVRKRLKEPENDGEQGVGKLGADNWLDRLQTGPKAFLRNKFRYQYERQGRKDAK